MAATVPAIFLPTYGDLGTLVGGTEANHVNPVSHQVVMHHQVATSPCAPEKGEEQPPPPQPRKPNKHTHKFLQEQGKSKTTADCYQRNSLIADNFFGTRRDG